MTSARSLVRWRQLGRRAVRSPVVWFAVLALVPLVAVSLLLGVPGTRSTSTSTIHVSAPAGSAVAPASLVTSSSQGILPTSSSPALTLRIANSPSTICALGGSGCPAGTGVSRVTLTAIAGGNAVPAWPNVEVAFVIETTAYDGVYNHYFGYPGTDKCATANPGAFSLPCEESNGVPFFMANAGQIASAISAANPHSHVSFALVDFFATDGGDWDDGLFDGSKYHVDIPQFIPSSEFGSAVVSSMQDQVFGGAWSGVIGLDDNFLHSPSITALYGTIIGSGLDWSPNTHHVIVMMGSTAPRDPSYTENYRVSPFDACCGGTQDLGWTCEPSFAFGSTTSPNCEGWVKPQDGNPQDSIAALAHNSPTCSDSVGGVCTIDTIDLWTTPTDPLSPGWPTGIAGGGPGGPIVQLNVNHVLAAGCDLAAATGGSWDGPAYATCPDGRAGALQFVVHGPYDHPNVQNPTLMNAFRHVSFGPVYNTLVANGTDQAIFRFVPAGNIQVAPSPQWSSTCALPLGGFASTCQVVPTILHTNGITSYGWNWSTNRSSNALYLGDTWSTSFNVIDGGPPFATVPVDACITVDCRAGGSAAVNGLYTSATFRPYTNVGTVVESFPLARVTIELTPAPAGQVSPPPAAPPIPPGLPISIAPALPVANPIGTFSTVGVANVSLQATAAGFLGAGFIRVGMKNRPIAMKMAALTGKVRSRFEKAETGESSSGVGRFD